MEVKGKLVYYLALMFTLQHGLADFELSSLGTMETVHNQGTSIHDYSQMDDAKVLSEKTYPKKADDSKETSLVYQTSDGINICSNPGNRHINLTREEDCQIVQEVSLQNSAGLENIMDYEFGVTIPDSYIVYINSGLSVQIMTVNIIVVCIFLQKKNRSPLTILLSSLAISDTISAVIASLLEFIGYTFFSNQIVNNFWKPKYPHCTFVHYFIVANYDFHLASIYITAVLSAQKAIAVLFPLWSRTNINNKVCVVISSFIFGFVLCLYVTLCALNAHYLKVINDTCYIPIVSMNIFIWFVLPTIISYVLCVTVILVSTGILCCKLTCCRENILLNNFRGAQYRNRKSAVIVILICVIFVLSEGMMLYSLSVEFWINIVHFDDHDFSFYYLISFYLSSQKFLNLSWMIGYCLNFIVYLLMGRKLRKILGKGCFKICNIFRCCH